MLEIKVLENEIYLPKINKFITIPECTLTLEHSLISLAKWESKWNTPYFDYNDKTRAQNLDYIRCMVIGKIKNDATFDVLSPENITTITDYINAPMTATTFQKRGHSKNKREIVTAETIYARMFAHRIPMECEKWHLNRLLTLLRVCDLQNSPREKMTKQQTASWNAQQNAARRAKYNTRG